MSVETESASVESRDDPSASSEAAAEREQSAPQPARRRSTVPHWLILVASLVVLGLSFTLSASGEHRVHVPGTRIVLPGLCVFRSTVGIDCPGCGMTRCFISLAHGEFARAWQFNPAGFLFFAVVAVQLPFQLAQIIRIRTARAPFQARYFNWVLVAVAVCLVLQWVVKMGSHIL